MKHVFPSVKPRRLGTRGNSRYCYSGLKKRDNIKPPSLQDFNIGADLYDNTCVKELKEVDNAACHLICEWAEKLLSKKFYSIKELAVHLIENLYIDTQSVAALTLLSTSSQNKDIGCLANTLFKQTNGGKKRKQIQVQPQKCRKEQKKKVNKYACTNTNNFKKQEIKKLPDKVHSTAQHSNLNNQNLKIPNAYKISSADVQNTLPIKEHVNSYALSDVPSTSGMNDKFSDKCVESKIFHSSIVVADDVKRKFSNNDYMITKEGNDVNSLNQNIKNGEKYSSKSVEFNKFDYENAYNKQLHKNNTSRDSFLPFKKEYLENASIDSGGINITKCPRMDILTSDFNANILPSIHELENKNDNFIQTSSATSGILPNKNISIQENTLPENVSLQNSENIHETNKDMQTNSSQLRMLLEKNLSPVIKSKITTMNNDQGHLSRCVTADENKNIAQNMLLNNEAKTLKFLFSNMQEHLKKDNFHSAKLSLIAETHNKSIKLATDFQEFNRENIHPESSSLLYSHDDSNSKKIIHTGNYLIPNIHSNNDTTQSKSFDFVPVSVKQDFYNRQHSFDLSNSLQMPEKSVNPVTSINNQKLLINNMHKDSNEVYQNYSQPNSPFVFPQQAFPSVRRPRHHSSHNIGHSYNKFVQSAKHYNSYQSGSRARHFSGPIYSKPDSFLETHIYGSDPVLGNKTSGFQTVFSPLHMPVSSTDLHNNKVSTNEITKASQHLSDIAAPNEIHRRNCSEASHHFESAKKIHSDANQIPPLTAVIQAPDDFSYNSQQLFLNKEPSLNINRCQSVPPHKMLQMLIDQTSPVNSPIISKSYPTTPVVNQIFQFPVSQYEPDISIDPMKLLSESNQGVSNVLMEEWHSMNINDTNNNAVCQPTMTELLEQPLDDELQTTLEDLKECDEFSRFTQHLEKQQ